MAPLRPWLAALLGRRRSSRTGARSAEPVVQIDDSAWTLASGPDALSRMLSEIETTALEVYAANGLPTEAGHYAMMPNTRVWRFIAENLPPEERWSIALNHPVEEGWRYAALKDLGAQGGLDNSEDVQAAAALLEGCSEVRIALKEKNPDTASDVMQSAIQLGADWRGLQQRLKPTKRAAIKKT